MKEPILIQPGQFSLEQLRAIHQQQNSIELASSARADIDAARVWVKNAAFARWLPCERLYA